MATRKRKIFTACNLKPGVGFVKRPDDVRFWEKVEKGPEGACWPWLGCAELKSGRGLFFFKGRMQSAPRVAWELTNKTPFPPDLDACHSCDNPWCCNPRHIWAGTDSENIRDAVAKGRHHTPKGSKHCMSKLTEEQVIEMKRLRAEGVPLSELGRRYGVGPGHIGRIVKGLAWKHVA